MNLLPTAICLKLETMRLDEKLKKLCDENGWDSQTDLVRIAKIPKSTVHRWMNGTTLRPKVEHVLKLARAIRVPVEYLLDDAMHELPAKDELTSDEVQVLELYRALKEDPAEGLNAREAMRRLRRPSLAKDTGPEPGRGYGDTRPPRKPIDGHGNS